MNRWPRFLIVALLLALPQLVSVGQPATGLNGKVVGVTDGDTLTLLDEANRQHKIRLEGIDAPESAQPFGTQAKKALSDKVFGKSIRVEKTGTDKYGRTLGRVYVGNSYVNRELLAEGMAWHYKEFNRDIDLAEAEDKARAEKRGLWRKGSEAIPPWDFRHAPKIAAKPVAKAVAAAPKKGPASVVVYTTDTGEKYHRDGCVSLRKSKHETTLAQAKSIGYQPCKLCRPPQ